MEEKISSIIVMRIMTDAVVQYTFSAYHAGLISFTYNKAIDHLTLNEQILVNQLKRV